jgi:putative CocE/NonD family hydrolase
MAMASIAMNRDLIVPMRDGVSLFANLYRPTADRPYPVIMSVTPYGKDKLPDHLVTFFMRLSGVKFGKLNYSRLTGFESPDPVYWVQQGYAVLQADVRGMHKSEGEAGVCRQGRSAPKASCSIGPPADKEKQFLATDSSSLLN